LPLDGAVRGDGLLNARINIQEIVSLRITSIGVPGDPEYLQWQRAYQGYSSEWGGTGIGVWGGITLPANYDPSRSYYFESASFDLSVFAQPPALSLSPGGASGGGNCLSQTSGYSLSGQGSLSGAASIAVSAYANGIFSSYAAFSDMSYPNLTFIADLVFLPTATVTPTPTATGTPTNTATLSPTLTPTPTATALATAQATVGALGVTESLPNGTSVEIGPGALAQGTTVTMAQLPPSDSPPLGSYQTSQGGVYTFNAVGPNGPITQFGSNTVTLVFPYDPSQIPAGETAGQLQVEYYDGTNWDAVAATVNTTNDTLTAVVNHFSVWGVFIYLYTPTPTVTWTPTPEILWFGRPATVLGFLRHGTGAIWMKPNKTKEFSQNIFKIYTFGIHTFSGFLI